MRGSDFIRHSDPDLVKFQAGYASLFGGMARGIDTSVATTERITCLCGLWGQKNATSGETCAGTDFQQAAYEVLYECVGSMCKVFEHTQAKTRNVKQNLTILPECKKIIKRLCLLVKKPLDRTLIPQYRFNKTKQHTPKPPWFCGVNRFIVRLSSSQMRKSVSVSLTGEGLFPSGFSFSFSFLKLL